MEIHFLLLLIENFEMHPSTASFARVCPAASQNPLLLLRIPPQKPARRAVRCSFRWAHSTGYRLDLQVREPDAILIGGHNLR